ncbi:MAG: TonB-dependent receptor, partial [Saprospiraceae bacterium]|nr:TonB-dependent receptor [Saprospiraceae bacterium]
LFTENDTWGFRTRVITTPSPSWTLSTGMEAQFEATSSETFETLPTGIPGASLGLGFEDRDYFNLFAEAQWQVSERVLVTGGLNLNQTWFRSTFNQRKPAHLSPVISGSYAVIPGKIAAFASVSRGFVPISLANSRNADGTINPDLKPETGWNTEAGMRWEHGSMKAELTVYRMLIDNLVVQRRIAPDLYVAANAGETLHQGVEIAWEVPFSEHLAWSGAYTLTDHRFKEFVDGDDDFSGNDLTGSAPHTLHQALTVLLGTVQFRLDQHLIGRTPVTDDNLVWGETSHVIDAALTIPLRFDKVSPSLSLRVENVFDVHYAAMYQINAVGFGGSAPRYYYPGKPRAVYVGVRVDISGGAGR